MRGSPLAVSPNAAERERERIFLLAGRERERKATFMCVAELLLLVIEKWRLLMCECKPRVHMGLNHAEPKDNFEPSS